MCLSLFLALALAIPSAQAAGGTRTLYLYYTHTKETGKFTFRKNGNYDQKVLSELNVFLRDWRRDEPTKMDPALFDLIWEVYQEVGATNPIYIVSAYRAPETNEMLRSNRAASPRTPAIPRAWRWISTFPAFRFPSCAKPR